MSPTLDTAPNFWRTDQVRLRAYCESDVAHCMLWAQDSSRAQHLEHVWAPPSPSVVTSWVASRARYKRDTVYRIVAASAASGLTTKDQAAVVELIAKNKEAIAKAQPKLALRLRNELEFATLSTLIERCRAQSAILGIDLLGGISDAYERSMDLSQLTAGVYGSILGRAWLLRRGRRAKSQPSNR